MPSTHLSLHYHVIFCTKGRRRIITETWRKFAWQEGYGAFTVSPSQLSKVQRYIANQIEHHRKKTFEEEYVELLRLSGVEFDETYLYGKASHPSRGCGLGSNYTRGCARYTRLTPG